MTEQHPITPPPELVEKLRNDAPRDIRDAGVTRERHLVIAAYRAGADQELEACCEWIYKLMDRGVEWSMDLRISRRPKPPSLAKQGCDALDTYIYGNPKPLSGCRSWRTMTELSPAQVVLVAVKEISPAPADEIAAVALRVAVDQVVPGDGSRRANEIRSEFLAIVAELENHAN